MSSARRRRGPRPSTFNLTPLSGVWGGGWRGREPLWSTEGKAFEQRGKAGAKKQRGSAGPFYPPPPLPGGGGKGGFISALPNRCRAARDLVCEPGPLERSYQKYLADNGVGPGHESGPTPLLPFRRAIIR